MCRVVTCLGLHIIVPLSNWYRRLPLDVKRSYSGRGPTSLHKYFLWQTIRQLFLQQSDPGVHTKKTLGGNDHEAELAVISLTAPWGRYCTVTQYVFPMKGWEWPQQDMPLIT